MKLMFYNLVQTAEKSGEEYKMEKDNNRRFNDLLNAYGHPKAIYNTLLEFAKPCVQQADDVSQKRQIAIGEVLAFLDEAQGSQKAV